MGLIMYLVFGLIVGTLARLIVSGREPGGWIVSIAIGIAGSFAGGFLGRAFGFYSYGEPAGFVMSLVGAILVVVVYHAIARKRAAA